MSDEDISGADRFVPASELEITEVPDGAMVYQKDRERVHYINPTALIIFQLCGMGKSVDEITQFVSDSFDLPKPPLAEVQSCVRSFLYEGLVARM